MHVLTTSVVTEARLLKCHYRTTEKNHDPWPNCLCSIKMSEVRLLRQLIKEAQLTWHNVGVLFDYSCAVLTNTDKEVTVTSL